MANNQDSQEKQIPQEKALLFVQQLLNDNAKHITAIQNIVQKYCQLNTRMNKHSEFYEGNILFVNPDKTKPNPKVLSKAYNIYHIAQKCNNVLEIGVNSGYSAMIMLLANPKLKIRGFDICSHGYVEPCVQYLNEKFGNRITLVKGDSSKTVEEHIAEARPEYDLIHIDGCHLTNIAEADMKNCYALARKGKTKVIFDDTQQHNLGSIWKRYCQNGQIKPLKKPCPNNNQFQHEIGIYQ